MREGIEKQKKTERETIKKIGGMAG